MICLSGIVPVLGIVALLWLREKYDDAGLWSDSEYCYRKQIIMIIEKEDDDE